MSQVSGGTGGGTATWQDDHRAVPGPAAAALPAGAAASQRSLLQSNSSSNGSSIPPVTSSVSPSPSPAAGRSRPGSVDRWAAPGTPSPPGYICKQWYDVSGNDLTTLASILTADACAAACKAMAGCSHFVLTPACVLRGDLYAGAAGANGASGNVTLACIGITGGEAGAGRLTPGAGHRCVCGGGT